MKIGLLYMSLVTFIAINAQKAAGLYLSDADFIQNKLCFLRTGKVNYKIQLHDFYYKPYISVKTKDSVFTFLKDSIFGYKDSDGKVYRYYEKKKYPIINPSEKILLYKLETKIGEPKYQKVEVHYYFSKNPKSVIFPLTILNLEASFHTNPSFIEFLEIYFRSDSDLSEYDYNHNMYKLNRLLELSTKATTNSYEK